MKKVLLIFSSRPEAVETSTVKFIGTNPTIIVNEVKKLLKDISLHMEMEKHVIIL